MTKSYKMRKSHRELVEMADVEAVLRSARVLYLAMSVDDAPYVVPLNFGYVDGVIYFHCAREGRKIDMIRANEQVSFSVAAEVELIEGEIPCKWTTRFKSVIGFGRARVVEEREELVRGLDVLMAHHGAELTGYSEKVLAKVCVVAIEISLMTAKQLA